MHGDVVVLGASCWRVAEISPNRVTVTPAPGVPGKLPFWKGDSVGRPVELGREIGRVRARDRGGPRRRARRGGRRRRRGCARTTTSTPSRPRTCSRTSRTSARRRAPCRRTGGSSSSGSATSSATGGSCVLTPFGGRVHAPWTMALEARLQERLGLEVQTIYSDDGIAIRLPEGDGSLDGVEALLFPDPEEVEDLVVGRVGQSSLFASRFRENAARALLLPRRRPGTRTPLWQQRQRSADLLAVASRYGSFPILVETYRECLADVFDLDALREILDGVRRREIAVHSVETARASAFASSPAVRLHRRVHVRGRRAAGGAPGAGPHAGPRPPARAARPGGAARAARLGRARGPGAEPPGARRRAARPTTPTRSTTCCGGSATSRPTRWATGPSGGRPEASFHLSELAASRRAVRARIGGEERWIAMEDVARYRDGVGRRRRRPACRRRSSGRRSGRSTGCWPAMPGRTGRSSPPTRRAAGGCPVGVVEDALHRLVAAGIPAERRVPARRRRARVLRSRGPAAAAAAVAGEAAAGGRARRPDHAGAVPAGLAGRRAVAVGAGAGSRLAVRAARRRSSASRRWSTSSPACRSRPRSSSATCSRPGSPATSRGCSTSSGRWARSPGSGAGASGATTGGSSCYRPGRELLRPTGPPDGVERPAERDPRAGPRAPPAPGASFYRELFTAVGRASSDREVLDALWDLVWAGEVTNDTFAPLRALRWKRPAKDSPAEARDASPRSGRRRPPAAGRWSATRWTTCPTRLRP